MKHLPGSANPGYMPTYFISMIFCVAVKPWASMRTKYTPLDMAAPLKVAV